MEEAQNTAERVLIVDDQEAVARTIARWLERDGYECAVAHSVDEATEVAAAGSFGIVIADVHLPDASGLDLARSVKATDPAIQVIVITGGTALETAIEAIRLDTDDFLLKPFDPKELLHSVGRAAEHRRLILENRSYREGLEDRIREQAERLERMYLSSIHALATALEAKDNHTRGHSDRVGEYAVALLEVVGGVEPESLRVGAQLHDIGKIGIAGGILRKDGPLSGSETVHIKQHPGIGIQILAPLLEDRVVLDVVQHHHERWDGAGYPEGLGGDQIPLAARIVAVADAYDAMTTSRPYRAALSPEQAVAEIEQQAGHQFDPDVARHAASVFLGRVRKVS